MRFPSVGKKQEMSVQFMNESNFGGDSTKTYNLRRLFVKWRGCVLEEREKSAGCLTK